MFIKSLFLRIISIAIAAIMTMSVGFGSGDSYDVKDPENVKLNFSVLSDSHIEANNFTRYKVFSRALQDIKRNKSGNDAIVFLGDNTMNGQFLENALFHGTAALTLKEQTMLTVVGNHDIGNGKGDYQKLQNRWFDFTYAFFGKSLSKPYYYEVIDGYYFIVLGMNDQLVYEMKMTDEQFSWLEGVLAEAAKSERPVFVFSHYPADDVIDENGKSTSRLTDMLSDFNREHDLFSFVGHTHMPLYLFWSFHSSDGYPEIYLPRLTELFGDNDRDDNSRNTGNAVEVEVYENEVVVRGRNFYRSNWLVDDEDTGEMCEKTYMLKNPIG